MFQLDIKRITTSASNVLRYVQNRMFQLDIKSITPASPVH